MKVESWTVGMQGTVRNGQAVRLPALEMVDENGDIMEYRFFDSVEEAECWAEENLELLGFLRKGGKRQNYADFFTTYMEVGGCPFQGSVITPGELQNHSGRFSVVRHGIQCPIRAIYNPNSAMRRRIENEKAKEAT